MSAFAARAKRGIERCHAADLRDLHAFQVEHFGERSRQTDCCWSGWLRANPDLAKSGDNGVGLWICRREGAIVGQQGEIPFDLVVDGETVPAAWAIDLMVDPAWRLRGVGPALAETQWSSWRVVGALNLSDAAYKANVRAGWIDFGSVPVFVFPVSGRGMYRTRALRKFWQLPVALVAAGLARLTARLRSLPGRLVPVEQFDERADDIFRHASPGYRVLGRRDARWLAWRFDASPEAEQLARFYLERRGRAVGYVVLRARTWHDEPAYEVLDYLCAPHDVPALFGHVAVEVRRRRAIALLCKTLNRVAESHLRLVGFLPAQGSSGETKFMVKLDEHDALRPVVGNADHWFVTAADSDVALPD